MVMSMAPKYRIATVTGQLKSQSSSKLRKRFSGLVKVYWEEHIVWSPDCFVSSVGISEET
jgi:putative transposase